MARQMNAQAILPALCTSSDGHLSMYQVSFNCLLYFQRYAPDKLFIAKIKKGSNSTNIGDRVMVLAFCHSLHSPLLVYRVSFIYLQYFYRYDPEKLTIAKLRKGNKSVITWDRVTVLPLCTSSDGRLSMYHLHVIPFYTFRDMLQTSFLLQKLRREVTPSILVRGFLHSAIPFIALYHCIKFHLFIFYTFRDMLQTSLLLQNLEREITL